MWCYSQALLIAIARSALWSNRSWGGGEVRWGRVSISVEFQAYEGSVPACASIYISPASLQRYPDSLLSKLVVDLGLQGRSQEQGERQGQREGQEGAVAPFSTPVRVDLGGNFKESAAEVMQLVESVYRWVPGWMPG